VAWNGVEKTWRRQSLPIQQRSEQLDHRTHCPRHETLIHNSKQPHQAMTQENELKTIMEGKTPLDVTLNDGSTITVHVRQVPIRHMGELVQLKGDDEKIAELYLIESDRKHLPNICPDSVLDLLEKGDEVNDPLFERWWARQKRKVKKLGIDLDKEMSGIVELAKSSPASLVKGLMRNSSSTAVSPSSDSTSNMSESKMPEKNETT